MLRIAVTSIFVTDQEKAAACLAATVGCWVGTKSLLGWLALLRG